MVFTAYANTEDLRNWIPGAAPDNAEQLLRSATFLVAAVCFRDPYADPVADDTTAAVLRDATLSQAAMWIALGVDPAGGGINAKVVTESKIGSGSVKVDALTAEQVAEALTCLAPEARSILTGAGLIYQPAPSGADPCDELLRYGLDDPRRPFGWQFANEVDLL